MQFDFGQNWKEFSEKALTPDKIEEAKRAFKDFTDQIDLRNKTFLDIGFGQGLSLLIATESGAITVGCDINPKCGEVISYNRKKFPSIIEKNIPLVIGSILDTSTVDSIKKVLPGIEQFDVVHSWGVLHHTGNMDLAIKNTCSLVKQGGHFIIAIYNRHWTSPIWRFIKWMYCKSPSFIRVAMTYLFYPVIYTAKFIVTGSNPKKQERGMSFFYDIIDWIGGYPYEYATIEEMEAILQKLGFTCIKKIKARVPTGCNEFVFIKK